MHDYDPSSHLILLQEIAVAWAIALAVFVVLLLVPAMMQTKNTDDVNDGMETAIDQIITRETDFFAEGRNSP